MWAKTYNTSLEPIPTSRLFKTHIKQYYSLTINNLLTFKLAFNSLIGNRIINVVISAFQKVFRFLHILILIFFNSIKLLRYHTYSLLSDFSQKKENVTHNSIFRLVRPFSRVTDKLNSITNI